MKKENKASVPKMPLAKSKPRWLPTQLSLAWRNITKPITKAIKLRKNTTSIAGMFAAFLMKKFITAKKNVLNSMWRMPVEKKDFIVA
jgi:hypothetical protein